MATQRSLLLWAELTVRFVRSFCIDWAPFGKKSLSVIRNSRVVAVQGFSFYCGNGDAIGTSVSVRYIVDVRSSGVVVKRGSTVHADFNYLTMYGYDAKRLF